MTDSHVPVVVEVDHSIPGVDGNPRLTLKISPKSASTLIVKPMGDPAATVAMSGITETWSADPSAARMTGRWVP